MGSRIWCFTLNNPCANDLPASWPSVKDAAWQLEKGEEGTPHLQGFVRFNKNHRLSACKKLNGEAHWEVCRDPAASVKYCTKEDSRVEGPWILGEPTIKKGQRTDLEHAVQELKAGTSLDQLFDDHPNLLRYSRSLQDYSTNLSSRTSLEERKVDKSSATLRYWQKEALEWLQAVPDDRTILWIYETEGNVGKSWFADYLGVVLNAFVVNPGKKADIAHSYGFQPIVVFDCSRTSSEGGMDVVYGVAEDFKNGRIFSPKYDSRIKVFKPPHVVFLSNVGPDYGKWSKDRYSVWKVENDQLVEQEGATGLAPGFHP